MQICFAKFYGTNNFARILFIFLKKKFFKYCFSFDRFQNCLFLFKLKVVFLKYEHSNYVHTLSYYALGILYQFFGVTFSFCYNPLCFLNFESLHTFSLIGQHTKPNSLLCLNLNIHSNLPPPPPLLLLSLLEIQIRATKQWVYFIFLLQQK